MSRVRFKLGSSMMKTILACPVASRAHGTHVHAGRDVLLRALVTPPHQRCDDEPRNHDQHDADHNSLPRQKQKMATKRVRLIWYHIR